jgi:Flp pilus assembly protein CpaB
VSRRSRAWALLGIAAVCAGLAASIVNGYARDVRAQVGPLTPVIVARTKIPRGRLLTDTNVSRYLAARRVPVQFVPPRSLRFARDVIGLSSRVQIPAGSYLSESLLADPSVRGGRLPQDGLGGMRVVEVAVAGAAAMESALRPGARVDVLITSERGPDAPRTYLALQRIELAGFRPGGPGDGAAGEAQRSMASLRVTLRQAVLLTAAANFARELRLVPRPAGEDHSLPPAAVSAQDLRP